MQSKQRRVLLVAYDFPPLPTPQSLRWGYLVRELAYRGWIVDVLTISLPEQYQFLLRDLPSNIGVFRTFPGPFFYFVYKYSTAARDMGIHEKRRSFQRVTSMFREVLKAIRRLLQKVLDYLLIPDARIEWFPFAYFLGRRLIRENSYDLIISSSEPPISHIIGYFLHRSSGIPWVIDNGDPWLYPIPNVSKPEWKVSIEGKIEELVLKRVRGMTVPTEQIKRYYMEKYNFLKDKNIAVVPQGYDPDKYNAPLDDSHKGNFLIVYTGSFHKNIRDPYITMQALSALKGLHLKVHIAGFLTHEYSSYLRELEHNNMGSVLKYLGPLSHDDTIGLQRRATVLLLIDNAGGIQIPGKIFEYLAARRPILVVQSSENSPAGDIVPRLKRGIVAKNIPEDIQKAIHTLYRWWEDGTLDRHFDLKSLPPWSWQDNGRILDEWLRLAIAHETAASICE